jgi:hypothetical protein
MEQYLMGPVAKAFRSGRVDSFIHYWLYATAVISSSLKSQKESGPPI